ncbi:hypothetical protein [Paenibacillus dauci]|uniref:hypothetical protein n=1 Tax=Paenibacillus dauci TaxID=1567106 RepID=UPI00061A0651|nr:hypothetical protein [Paenibacillus dauci]
MKSLLRNITVDHRAFVYWYSSGACFTLNLSPKENKNIKITLLFKANPPDEDPYTFWAFYDISAQRDGLDTTIHLGKPRHIAEILSYLLTSHQELWTQTTPQIIDHAWEILEEMGYTNPTPLWIGEW